eukprot:scaffold910_cov115-Isochrysis_galbana.AAC.8
MITLSAVCQSCVVPGRIVLCWVCYGLKTGFYPKKGGVESTTAGCNGGRCLVVPCERIGEWAVRVPVGQRRLRRSPPALRPRIRRRREWVVHYQLSPSV